MSAPACTIRFGRPDDVPTIFGLIKGLAEYERLSHEVVGDRDLLREHLFGARPYGEVLLAEADGERSASRCSSTTTRRSWRSPGIYLEDLFVLPERARPRLRQGAAGRRWRGWRSSAAAAGWSGRCSTGTSRRSSSTALGAVAMDDWTVNRVTGEALERLASQGPPVTTA